jgi:hypothetical protein
VINVAGFFACHASFSLFPSRMSFHPQDRCLGCARRTAAGGCPYMVLCARFV